MPCSRDNQLYVIGIQEKRLENGRLGLTFRTAQGRFRALAQLDKGMDQAVVLLSGAGGGFDGPCALYSELADELYQQGIGSLRLDYRIPGDCMQCTIDTLLSVQYLDDEAVHDVVIVGWSFGGSVALSAGSVAKNALGVAAVATNEVVDCCIKRLRSKSLLLIHGDADTFSPIDVSRRIYSESDEPRKLLIYPGVSHSFSEVKNRLCDDLVDWIVSIFKASVHKEVPLPTFPD